MLPNSSAGPSPAARATGGTRFASSGRARGIAVVFACALMLPACGEPNLPPVLTAAHVETDPIKFLPVPAPEPETPRTLLQEMAARPPGTPEEWDDEARGWVLPYKTKRIDVVLLIALAHGDERLLARVLAPHAEWGLPDRRMLGAQPIFGDDGGERFFHALHRAAMRFPENATWKSQATLDGVTQMYQTGAEPMWTYFEREGQNDWIVLRKSMFKGRPVIDYVGLWDGDPPTTPTQIAAEIGPPPPLAPPVDRSMMPAMPGMPPEMVVQPPG